MPWHCGRIPMSSLCTTTFNHVLRIKIRGQQSPIDRVCCPRYPSNEMQKHAKCASVNRITHLLQLHLVSEGWRVKIKRRFNFSYDIDAVRDKENWIIEINSTGNAALTETFVAALGEILQRMDIDDPNLKYSVAFPDNIPFRRLWERLPALAKKKIGITALFVEETGNVIEID